MSTSRRDFLGTSTSLALLSLLGYRNASGANEKAASVAQVAEPNWYLIVSRSISTTHWVKQCGAALQGLSCMGPTTDRLASAWGDTPELISNILQQLKGKRVVLLVDARDDVVLHIGLRELQAAILWEGTHDMAQDPIAMMTTLARIAEDGKPPGDSSGSARQTITATTHPCQQIISLVAQL